jgi:hypothetical protein
MSSGLQSRRGLMTDRSPLWLGFSVDISGPVGDATPQSW